MIGGFGASKNKNFLMRLLYRSLYYPIYETIPDVSIGVLYYPNDVLKSRRVDWCILVSVPKREFL